MLWSFVLCGYTLSSLKLLWIVLGLTIKLRDREVINFLTHAQYFLSSPYRLNATAFDNARGHGPEAQTQEMAPSHRFQSVPCVVELIHSY